MNKMQMTITKEKLQHMHKNYNMKRHQLMNERLKTLELHCAWKNVAVFAVSKFVRRDFFWWQQAMWEELAAKLDTVIC